VQAEKHGMNVSSNCWMEVEPVPMSKEVYETMYKAAESLHIPSQLMISGAGHDAQVMGSYYPTALLFVPSEAGVSHSPKEYTKSSDLEQGVKVLEETLFRLAY
jgi:allantoate deiminase